MLRRLGSGGYRFFVKKEIKPSQLAVIGFNPEMQKLLLKMKLEKYINPIFLQDESEMMVPGPYDAALVAETTPQQMDQFLSKQKHIQWVHTLKYGVDTVLCERLINSKIPVTSTKLVAAKALSEMVLFGMLSFLKNARQFQKQREARTSVPCSIQHADRRSVGIFGYGRLGYTTAQLLKYSLNSIIFACDLSPSKIPKKRLEFCDKVILDDDWRFVLNSCDFIINALPKTIKTENYFNLEKFQEMRKGSFYINVGNPYTTSEPDLLQALEEKKIEGAFMDIFQENPLPPSSPFYSMDNVIISFDSIKKIEDYGKRVLKIFAKELFLYKNGMESSQAKQFNCHKKSVHKM